MPLLNTESMARPVRIEYTGAHYHVTSRGNGRKAVFRDETQDGRSARLELLNVELSIELRGETK